MLKPCEKYSAFPLVNSGFSVGQNSFWPASERRYWTMVPRRAASSGENSVSLGFQPSGNGQLPAARARPLADHHLDAVVLHVQRLAAPLHPVAQDRHRLAAEDVLDLLGRIIAALDHCFGRVANLDLPHVLA